VQLPTMRRLAKVSIDAVLVKDAESPQDPNRTPGESPGTPTLSVGAFKVTSNGAILSLRSADAADLTGECERLGKEITRLAELITGQEKKLGNQQFTSKAPAAVVEREREKLASWREQHEVLARKRALLGCGNA
jgi:valyl-tRNA synthetase